MSQHHSAAAHADHAHGGLKAYIVGFALSIVLTIASFWAVMSGALPRSTGLAAILALCVLQLLVQLVFFLHLGTSPEQRDNLSAFLFTGLVIAIIIGGSAWVLHNMNVNMMPSMRMDAEMQGGASMQMQMPMDHNMPSMGGGQPR